MSSSGLAAGESCTEQLTSSGVDYFAFDSLKGASLRYNVYFARTGRVLALEPNLATVIPGHPEMTADQEREASLTRPTPESAPRPARQCTDHGLRQRRPRLVRLQAISYDEPRHRLILGEPQPNTPYTRNGATFNCPSLDLDASPPLELQTADVAGTPD